MAECRRRMFADGMGKCVTKSITLHYKESNLNFIIHVNGD
jgi:hypothetical protein